ncbi:MAG: NPCBM/NEW2 domain-containing protein [Candidatus Brocadiia bacterium]
MKAKQLLLCALMLAAPVFASEPPLVQCLRTGRGSETGTLLGIEGEQITLSTNAGEQSYPLEKFREIVFEAQSMAGLDPSFRVRLEDGSELMVHRIAADGDGERLRLEGYGWRALRVPLERVRSVATRRFMRTAPADEKEDLRQLQAEPPRTSDLLLATRGGERTRASVVVTGLAQDGVTVSVRGRARTIPWENLGWLVLARTASQPHAGPPHVVELTCGSTLRAASVRFQQGALTAAAEGIEYTIEPDRLLRLRVGSDAYRYVSDMTPDSVETEPYLDVVWPPRMDVAVTGDQLGLEGTTYPKGIGMHARTRMTFGLGARYKRFHATIGVDDAAGPRGSVVFRVVGDGRELLSTDPMTGDAAPRPVSVDITGVENLTLIADWGDPVVGSGNLADWAEGRVVRAAGSSSPLDSPPSPD